MASSTTRKMPRKRTSNAPESFIAYYRVSTDKQGASGLGLDAQKEAVSRIAAGAAIVATFTEVESGKKHTNRPQLLAALEECKRRGAVLLIAKLDRLARNVHFISGLMESGVEFIAADNPHATKLLVHLLAAFAEHEREQISKRTKDALAAAKARGQQLGNPRWQESIRNARAARAVPPPAEQVVDIMTRLRDEGKSLRAIAEHVNGLGVKSPKGAAWHASTVRATLRIGT